MNDYLNNMFQLDGKTAVITGGAGHLCGTMAVGLAKAGCQIVVVDKSEEKTKTMVDKIKGITDHVIGMSVNVVEKSAHEQVLAKTKNRFKKVDILINGAGINAPTPFLEIPLDEWREILDSHITSTMLGCQVFGAHMIENQKGCIMNMSSASSGPPLSKAFTYSVAKSGIKNLTQNLGREWAPHNVRVNALKPGFFPTEWSMKNFIDKDREAAIHGHTPMGRYGQPEELLGAVLWLCSEAAGFVTGAEIAVDGGFSCMTI